MQRLVGLGSEASVVGFVWVGYILGGVVLGYLLDSHFHTSFWTPVLLLFGAVMGFREMLRTISTLGKSGSTRSARNSSGVKTQSGIEAVGQAPASNRTEVAANQVVDKSQHRERIFQVPAPPQPSWSGVATPADKIRESQEGFIEGTTGGKKQAGEPPSDQVSSSEELIRKLLSDTQTSHDE